MLSFLQWNVVQVIAFGVIVWLWNKLGLSERATLIGNIAAIILLVIVLLVSSGQKGS